MSCYPSCFPAGLATLRGGMPLTTVLYIIQSSLFRSTSKTSGDLPTFGRTLNPVLRHSRMNTPLSGWFLFIFRVISHRFVQQSAPIFLSAHALEAPRYRLRKYARERALVKVFTFSGNAPWRLFFDVCVRWHSYELFGCYLTPYREGDQ